MSTQLYTANQKLGSLGAFSHDLAVDVVVVTPEMAQNMLAINSYERQRNVRTAKVSLYVEAMRKGRFEPGSMLSFGIVGQNPPKLLDGQHRLHAVIKSGKPQTFVIRTKQYETDEDFSIAYGHFDQHSKRSLTDTLRAAGIDSEFGFTVRQMRHMASAVKAIHESRFGADRKATANAIEDLQEWIRYYVDAAELYWEAIDGAPGFLRSPLDRAATMSVALVTCKFGSISYGEDKTFDFWRGIALDDGLSANDPRKVANRHLLTAVMSSGNGGNRDGANRVTPAYSARYLANCWNAWIENRKIGSTNVRDVAQDIHILGTPFVRA